MSLEIIDCAQRSDEWYAARRGLVTASMVGQLVTATTKTGIDFACPKCKANPSDACLSVRGGVAGPEPIKTIHPERTAVAAKAEEVVLRTATGDTFRSIVNGLAAERVSDEEYEPFTSRDMLRGIEYEPVIRDRYAEVTGQAVTEVGFLIRTLPGGVRLGCSPDGLIGDQGGIEIKAPRSKGHVQTVVADDVPAQYVAQVQAALLVTGASWWDFVSAADGCLYVKRVLPDPAWLEAITDAVTAAEKAIEQKTSDYLIRRASLPTIAPYVEHNDWELKL